DAASAAHLGKERSIASSLVVGFHASLRIFFTGLLATIAVTLVGVVFQLISTPIENALLLFLITLVYFFAIFFIQASWFVSTVVAARGMLPVAHRGPLPSPRGHLPGAALPRPVRDRHRRRDEPKRRRHRGLHRALRGHPALDAPLLRHDDGALLRPTRPQGRPGSAARGGG